MSQKPTFDYDYIVIGSGAGGSPAPRQMASAGEKKGNFFLYSLETPL